MGECRRSGFLDAVRCGEVWGGEGEDWIVGGYLDLFRKNDAEADCQTRHFYGMIDEPR